MTAEKLTLINNFPYRTIGGEYITITKRPLPDGATDYTFIADNGETYTDTGLWTLDSYATESAKSRAIIMLQDGGVYTTAEGEVTTIKLRHDYKEAIDDNEHYLFVGSNGFNYKTDGRLFDSASSHDIVAYVDPAAITAPLQVDPATITAPYVWELWLNHTEAELEQNTVIGWLFRVLYGDKDRKMLDVCQKYDDTYLLQKYNEWFWERTFPRLPYRRASRARIRIDNYHHYTGDLFPYNHPMTTLNPITNWQFIADRRTQKRIESGEYQGVPSNFPQWPTTGVHISTQDPSMLAYYPTERHIMEDRAQQIRAGRYLKKYYPEKSDDWIREKCGLVATGDLVFYSDWHDIFRVYRELDEAGIVSSCMSYDKWGSVHPLMVYHNSDVGLAALMVNGKPVARALYNKQNKHYPMIYGQWEKMRAALDRAGFVHASLCGAKIKRVERYPAGMPDLDTPYTGDELLLPYIDHVRDLDRSSAHSTSVNVYDTYIEIQYNGEFSADRHEDVYLNLNDSRFTCRCENCDDGMHEDDSYWLEADEINVCRHCFDHHVVEVYTSRSNSFYALESTADHNYVYVSPAGRWYSEPSVASDAGYCYSEEDGDWYDEDDCVFVEELNDYVHNNQIGKTIIWDEEDGEYVTIETYNEREAERTQTEAA